MFLIQGKLCSRWKYFLKNILKKMFHEDVVQVVRKRLEQEEHLPEEQRPTALARSYYLKVRLLFEHYSIFLFC